MKQLLLLRHAKSSWDDPSLADFDRPLAKRGRKAATAVGREIAAHGWAPRLALVSPAKRTRQTWKRVRAELPHAIETVFDETLYEAEPDAILRAICATPATVSALIVVGHNPGLEEFAAALAGPGSDAGALASLREKFPTAALARFEFEGEWETLRADRVQLIDILRPGEIHKDNILRLN